MILEVIFLVLRVVGLRKSKLEERVLALELWQTPPPLSKEVEILPIKPSRAVGLFW